MSYSGYPIAERVKEIFSLRKTKYLKEHGYFKTLGGNWMNNHFHRITLQEIKEVRFDQLHKIIQ